MNFAKQIANLGTETAFAPQHAMAQGPFRRVVGRFHSFSIYKRPQRLLHRENLLTGARRLGMGTLRHWFSDIIFISDYFQ